MLVGCTSDDAGSAGEGSGGATGSEKAELVRCVSATDCPVLDNECLERACHKGFCGIELVPAGTPVASQIAQDCRRVVCDGNGGRVAQVDDADLPQDNNDCTVDACDQGVATYTRKEAGSSCGSATCGADGDPCVCNDVGQCVGCTEAADCGEDQPCLSWRCEEATCVADFVGDGELAAPEDQEEGDCAVILCDGGGNELPAQRDDADVPADDGSDCTTSACVDGEPVHAPVAEGTECATGGGQYCSASGLCVECTEPAHCPDLPATCQASACPEHCQQIDCQAHVCQLANRSPGYPLPADHQEAEDCQQVVCDGAGGITVANDPSDAPTAPGLCLVGTCESGTPVLEPLAPETTCDVTTGWVCDGLGSCVQCVTDAQCTAPATCGGLGVPNQCGCDGGDPCVGLTCGYAIDDCGRVTDCNNGGEPDGDETDVDCGGSVCAGCALGETCSQDSDCLSGHCVDTGILPDPICCNTSCTSPCMSCAVDHTGVDSGSCMPVAAGTDPYDDCRDDRTLFDCDYTGQCNGGGACEMYAEDTRCAEPACHDCGWYGPGFCQSGTCSRSFHDCGGGVCGGNCTGSSCQCNYTCNKAVECCQSMNTDCNSSGYCCIVGETCF